MRAHLLASYTARTDMTQVLAPPGVHLWGVPRTTPASAQLGPRIAPSAYNIGRLRSASTVSYPFQPQDRALASRPSLGMASVGSSASVALPSPVPPEAYNIGRLRSGSVRSYPIGTPPSEENSERVLAESAAAGIDVSAAKPARNVDPSTALIKVKALMEGDIDINDLNKWGEFANRLKIYAALSKVRPLTQIEQAAVDEIDREASQKVTELAVEDAGLIESKYATLREAERELQAGAVAEALATTELADPRIIRNRIIAATGADKQLELEMRRIANESTARLKEVEAKITDDINTRLDDERIASQEGALMTKGIQEGELKELAERYEIERDIMAKEAIKEAGVKKNAQMAETVAKIKALDTKAGLPAATRANAILERDRRVLEAKGPIQESATDEEKKARDIIRAKVDEVTDAVMVQHQKVLERQPVKTSIEKREAAIGIRPNQRFWRREVELEGPQATRAAPLAAKAAPLAADDPFAVIEEIMAGNPPIPEAKELPVAAPIEAKALEVKAPAIAEAPKAEAPAIGEAPEILAAFAKTNTKMGEQRHLYLSDNALVRIWTSLHPRDPTPPMIGIKRRHVSRPELVGEIIGIRSPSAELYDIKPLPLDFRQAVLNAFKQRGGI